MSLAYPNLRIVCMKTQQIPALEMFAQEHSKPQLQKCWHENTKNNLSHAHGRESLSWCNMQFQITFCFKLLRRKLLISLRLKCLFVSRASRV